MNTQLPPRVDAALMHALCKAPVWNGSVDVGTARKIVAEQLEHCDDGAADLTPLFKYLEQSGPHGVAARCVREVADELEAAGMASCVPELSMRRGVTRTVKMEASPKLRTVLGTRAQITDRAPLFLFVAFMVLLVGCFVMSGG